MDLKYNVLNRDGIRIACFALQTDALNFAKYMCEIYGNGSYVVRKVV